MHELLHELLHGPLHGILPESAHAFVDGVVIETLAHNLSLFPFLYVTYLILHFIQSKAGGRTRDLVSRAGRLGPLFGGLLGVIPQCGFSAAATGLFAGRLVTVGTLLAVYLSTSDEMLPILLSEQIPPMRIFGILGIKVLIGIAVGFLADTFWRRSAPREDIAFFGDVREMGTGARRRGASPVSATGILRNPKQAELPTCPCCTPFTRNGKPLHPLLSSLLRALQIFGYILLVSFVLNLLIFFIGEEALAGFLSAVPLLGCLLAATVGLIPNCAASVVITKLWVEGMLSFGAMLSGLLVGAGVGVMLLIRMNKSKKESLAVIGVLFLSGLACGIIADVIGMLV